ncbi:hypothetical protein Tco_0723192 [Tanacetum coccineum]
MHNNIMAAGSRDRPPMLATGRYAQWRSRFYDSMNKTKLVMLTNKNVDTTPKVTRMIIRLDIGIRGQIKFVGGRESVCVQSATVWIQCFNCKEFGHYAKEWQKAKNGLETPRSQGKDVASVIQAEKVFNFKQSNLTAYRTRMRKLMNQELEAHYIHGKDSRGPNADSCTDAEPLEQYTGTTILIKMCLPMMLQLYEQSNLLSNTCVVETGDSNVIPDSPNMCDNE